MARYIDADKLIKSLELSIKSWGRDCNSNAPIMMLAYQDALYRVKNIPTADVAPKSEVDQLQRKYDLAVAEREANVKGFAEEIAKTKTEVARKIFEEIEKSVYSKIPPHIRPIFKDDRDFEDGFRDGKTDALIEILVIIAELKKKIHGGKEG